MRIHTNALPGHVLGLHRDIDGVSADVQVHGSRTHRYGLEVQLSGSGYRRNSGHYGASDEIGATWDEWGIWLNLLFELDPGARVGRDFSSNGGRPIYANREDFHHCTDERYKTLKVADQHRRHTWRWETDGYGRSVCKCGAAQYPSNAANPHASLARR